MKTNEYDLIVVGGGAAGFFCAIQCAQKNASLRILILEKSSTVLGKVKVSGGGRCNVTHACFDPKEMVENYPRGKKELLGPFHRFLCGDMMAWLEDHGVPTKIEADGRVFPVSNKSQDIIDCFERLCHHHQIDIRTAHGVKQIDRNEQQWKVWTKDLELTCTHLLFATGSSPASWKLIQALGHSIVPPVPSLFTFNIQQTFLDQLPGVSIPQGIVQIKGSQFTSEGPILITHWGLSGPAILKLSAWAANELNAVNYQFSIGVNWVNQDAETVMESIHGQREQNGKQLVASVPLFHLPKRLWHELVKSIGIHKKNFADLTKSDLYNLTNVLTQCAFSVNGKSTFKEEFVTCGGVDTKEVNFKTMESKLCKQLYFAGEVLNIDAITGGFNFQAAWTEAFIAAENIATIS